MNTKVVMAYAAIPPETEHVGSVVIGAAIEVHRHLGPGFLERIYKDALCIELPEWKVTFEREKSVNVTYKGIRIPGQRIDLIVGGCVVIELKAVATLHAVHEAKVVIIVSFVAQPLCVLDAHPAQSFAP